MPLCNLEVKKRQVAQPLLHGIPRGARHWSAGAVVVAAVRVPMPCRKPLLLFQNTQLSDGMIWIEDVTMFTIAGNSLVHHSASGNP